MDENQIIYADEEETVVYQVKFLKEALEMSSEQEITDLVLLRENRKPAGGPHIREWIFAVTYATADGEQEEEVLIGLEAGDTTLHLYTQGRRKMRQFSARTRDRAKEGISDLTLDYIEQLERTGEAAWRMWQRIIEYLRNTPSLRLSDVEEAFGEYRKVGCLRPDPPHSSKE